MDPKPAMEAKERAAPVTLALNNVVLARLMDEVRNNAASAPTAYNRMHNRHNR